MYLSCRRRRKGLAKESECEINVKLERKQDERCWENTLAKKKRNIDMNMKRQYIY